MNRNLARRLAKIEGDSRPRACAMPDDERKRRIRELISKMPPLQCVGPTSAAVTKRIGLTDPIAPDAFKALTGRQQLEIMRARAEDKYGENWRQHLPGGAI